MKKDVTGLVKFGSPDGESLPLLQCACGEKYDWWDRILGIYEDMASTCNKCGRKLIFENKITIYEV